MNANARIRDEESCLQQPSSTQPPWGADPLHRRQSQAAARFTKKLAAWERSNGVGRLVKKEPPRVYPTWTAPASFTLHEGNFSSDGVILVTIMRSHSAADSR